MALPAIVFQITNRHPRSTSLQLYDLGCSTTSEPHLGHGPRLTAAPTSAFGLAWVADRDRDRVAVPAGRSGDRSLPRPGRVRSRPFGLGPPSTRLGRLGTGISTAAPESVR